MIGEKFFLMKDNQVISVQNSIDTLERESCFNKRRAFGHNKEYIENRLQWSDYPSKKFISDYPIHVDLELASLCDLNCPMCYTITEEFKSSQKAKLMSFELFKKIVRELGDNGVYSIRLSLRGEATLHKNFIEAIHYAKSAGVQEVSALTNGRSLNSVIFCKELVKSQLDWITVSVDGVDETYESIRKPIKFDEIVQGLRNLITLREELNSEKPAIKIQGIWPAVKNNVEKYLKVFSPISDLIYVNPLVDYLLIDKKEEIEYLDNFICPQIFQRLVIFADGKAIPCANDQFGEVVVGDANIDSIYEIWHSKKIQQFREDHVSCQALKKYKTCAECQLPRAREYEEFNYQGKVFKIENYTNRIQKIGS